MKDVLLILFGFLLALLPELLRRRKKLSVHWAALKAEAILCKEMAETYLNDNIKAPLYRLPTQAFSHSFPVLLAEGAVKENEVRELESFFGWVQDINRGLDNANECLVSGNLERIDRESLRLQHKTNELLREVKGKPAYLDRAMTVINKYVK